MLDGGCIGGAPGVHGAICCVVRRAHREAGVGCVVGRASAGCHEAAVRDRACLGARLLYRLQAVRARLRWTPLPHALSIVRAVPAVGCVAPCGACCMGVLWCR